MATKNYVGADNHNLRKSKCLTKCKIAEQSPSVDPRYKSGGQGVDLQSMFPEESLTSECLPHLKSVALK